MADNTPPDDTTPPQEISQPDPAPMPEEAPAAVLPPRKPFWRHAWFHWVFGLLVVGGIAALASYPVTRYWMLNHANVRSSASVTLVDEVTQQPLQHVRVSVAGETVHSDSSGRAVLRSIPLGPTALVITQPGFAEVRRNITIGWGSNPFDVVKLKAIGVPYYVMVTDWLSGKPIKGAHVESDDAAAISDGSGSAVLILPNNEAKPDVAVTVASGGYRTENATLKAATTVPVGLVTTRKAVYVSKQSGTYDVYASDADGLNRQVILPGTGNEGANISLAVSPDGTRAALVSTRDKQYDADGYLLSSLTLIDVTNGASTVLTHADQVQLIDWIGTRLVFEQATASDAKRYTVVSYDYASNSRFQLAAAARFNSVLSAQGMIYYAIAPNADDPSVQPFFYRVAPDGSGQLTLLEKEVWTVYHDAYDTFDLQTGDTWYTHTVSTRRNVAGSAPDAHGSKLFVGQPGQGARSLWVDTRGGKATLLLHNKADDKDTVLHDQPGLTYPVRWLNDDSALFRVVNGGETADYAIGTSPGRPPHKIADVTNAFGFSTGQ